MHIESQTKPRTPFHYQLKETQNTILKSSETNKKKTSPLIIPIIKQQTNITKKHNRISLGMTKLYTAKWEKNSKPRQIDKLTNLLHLFVFGSKQSQRKQMTQNQDWEINKESVER